MAKPVAGSKPATTIVKTGATTARAAAVKVVSGTAVPVPAMAATSTQFQEEGSTTLTTVLAGVLALLTWGTAGVLIASYLALI
jgi:methylthioribose-1-phosphate isomerase